MAISSETTIFVYREGDGNSLAIANAYIALHGMDNTTFISSNAPTGQMIPISCSPAEILADQSAFDAQVLTPILNAINDLTANGHQVWVIVLGFNVPAGFYDGSDIVSSVSRISRINHYSKQINNPFYNRQIFKRFDGTDALDALIVGRIDGPDLTTAMSLITQSGKIQQQVFVTGTFYFDPYSDRHSTGAGQYTEDLLRFQSTLLPILNLNIYSTTQGNPYIDSIIPSVFGDSFIWSWFTNRGSNSFFQSSNAFRFFAYNGDYDGAFTIRDPTDRRWVGLYQRNGYASTAGAMSNPTNNGLLRPMPFFNALLRGATVGEAYLYSVPYLDWTMTFIGDPLMYVNFPANPQLPSDNSLSQDESFRLMFIDLAQSIAFFVNKTNSLEDIVTQIVSSTDVETEVDLLDIADTLLNTNNDAVRQGQFNSVTQSFLNYIEKTQSQLDLSNTFPTLSQYLEGFKPPRLVSELIYDCQQNDNKLQEVDLLPEGYWEYEFVLADDALNFAFYHFQIEVATDPAFNDIIMTKSSLVNIVGWFYEMNQDDFQPITFAGVPSTYVGRRIRFESQTTDYLPRAELLYFRVRQSDQQTTYPYVSSIGIIYS